MAIDNDSQPTETAETTQSSDSPPIQEPDHAVPAAHEAQQLEGAQDDGLTQRTPQGTESQEKLAVAEEFQPEDAKPGEVDEIDSDRSDATMEHGGTGASNDMTPGDRNDSTPSTTTSDDSEVNQTATADNTGESDIDKVRDDSSIDNHNTDVGVSGEPTASQESIDAGDAAMATDDGTPEPGSPDDTVDQQADPNDDGQPDNDASASATAPEAEKVEPTAITRVTATEITVEREVSVTGDPAALNQGPKEDRPSIVGKLIGDFSQVADNMAAEATGQKPGQDPWNIEKWVKQEKEAEKEKQQKQEANKPEQTTSTTTRFGQYTVESRGGAHPGPTTVPGNEIASPWGLRQPAADLATRHSDAPELPPERRAAPGWEPYRPEPLSPPDNDTSTDGRDPEAIKKATDTDGHEDQGEDDGGGDGPPKPSIAALESKPETESANSGSFSRYDLPDQTSERRDSIAREGHERVASEPGPDFPPSPPPPQSSGRRRH